MMNGWVEQLISKVVADKIGKCWGFGSDTRYDPGPWEGELRKQKYFAPWGIYTFRYVIHR